MGEEGWKRDENFVNEALYELHPCNEWYVLLRQLKNTFSLTVDYENFRC